MEPGTGNFSEGSEVQSTGTPAGGTLGVTWQPGIWWRVARVRRAWTFTGKGVAMWRVKRGWRLEVGRNWNHWGSRGRVVRG